MMCPRTYATHRHAVQTPNVLTVYALASLSTTAMAILGVVLNAF